MPAFRALYLGAYPDSEPDAFTALGFEATQLMLSAIERAGSDDPKEARRFVTEIVPSRVPGP